MNEADKGLAPTLTCSPPCLVCNHSLSTRTLTNSYIVYPGDQINNVYTLNPSTGVWLVSATLTRGAKGIAAGEKGIGGSFNFDPKKYSREFYSFLIE